MLLVAAKYRASGFVLWLKADIQPPENDVCFTPNSGHSVSVGSSCEPNTADPKVYQGFFSAADQIPSITVSATVSFPFLSGWVPGMGSTLTFTISHEEVHYGQ